MGFQRKRRKYQDQSDSDEEYLPPKRRVSKPPRPKRRVEDLDSWSPGESNAQSPSAHSSPAINTGRLRESPPKEVVRFQKHALPSTKTFLRFPMRTRPSEPIETPVSKSSLDERSPRIKLVLSGKSTSQRCDEAPRNTSKTAKLQVTTSALRTPSNVPSSVPSPSPNPAVQPAVPLESLLEQLPSGSKAVRPIHYHQENSGQQKLIDNFASRL